MQHEFRRGFGVSLAGVLALVLLTTPALAGIRLASWNVRHLGWDNGMNYEAVSKVIGRFDLVAVQEVMDPGAAGKLARHIESVTGDAWGVLTSDVIGRTSYQEGYAFLWRKSAVDYVRGATLYLDPGDVFARQPFSAVFRDEDTGQPFVLATVHITYGDSIDDRIPEIQALDDYWRWLGQVYPGTPRVLTGDFNLAASRPAFNALDELADNLITRATTLSTDTGYASHYDHIWIGPELDGAGDNGVVPIMAWLGIGNDRARDHISDHAPVFLLIGDARLVIKPLPGIAAESAEGTTVAASCIKLNKAPKQALVRLAHVGPARAQAIIAGRPWPSVDALIAIDGIGDARLADIVRQGLLCRR